MTSKVVPCIECRHHKYSRLGHQCFAPGNMQESLVTGLSFPKRESCGEVRTEVMAGANVCLWYEPVITIWDRVKRCL